MIQAKALAELDGVQHRFFTRRGGVSERSLLLAQLRLRLGRSARQCAREPPPRRRRVRSRRGRSLDRVPDPFDRRPCRRRAALGLARRAQGGCAGDRPAGRRAGRAGGRLRAGAAGRSGCRRDRCRPCRLERRAGWRRRRHRRRHGAAGRQTREDARRGRPLHRSLLLRGRPRIPCAVPARTKPTAPSFAKRRAPAISCSISRATWRIASRASASRRMPRATTRWRRATISSATAAIR